MRKLRVGDKVRLTCSCHNGMTGIAVSIKESESGDRHNDIITVDCGEKIRSFGDSVELAPPPPCYMSM